jgi:hypothetical protein
VAQEPDRQVQVGVGRPAELGRAPGAVGEVADQVRALCLGQRQSEEGADPDWRVFSYL